MLELEDICLDGTVEGAINFRDLGGHRAADGTRVRRGVLYRAGMTHHITGAGLAMLTSRYQLCTVIDLRAAKEREEDGIARFADVGVRVHHVPVADTVNAPREIQRERYAEMRAGTFDWAASYMRMATRFPEVFRRVFELLAGPEAMPAVFHCTAGRDRTGVSAALVLASLGVAHDDIATDYARSGGYLRPHAARFIRQSSRMSMTPDEMARVLDTRAEAMHAFLDTLTRAHGSIEGYIASIGVSDGEIIALRERLLETA